MEQTPQSDDTSQLFACLDAGGTTFKCALINQTQNVVAGLRVPTTSPQETLSACVDFFKDQETKGLRAQSMGIASFGPLNIDPKSKAYGVILDGPKSTWAGTDLKTFFEEALNLSVGINTDVNGAMLAELHWGAAKGCKSAAYVTVGTGIGAGLYTNGNLIGEPAHPEFGHFRLKRHKSDLNFTGTCSVHGDCLEGLASAIALKTRFGDPEKLPSNHIAWEIEAYYLAQACNVLSLTLRPQRIILGGGIMQAPHLIHMIRTQYTKLLQGYLNQSTDDIVELIVTPKLGGDAGLFGGAYLAKNIVSQEKF